ncbi:L-threonylcarbamoyladenylate synthase [Salinisphaera aquimarina]|uniref:L-threonylcarbamoyladenylate synthase n=1 Tax=Salinisphaera aquimarina TaxID=2094031 RepID=A0ABV7ES92_9GAMM
MAQTVIDRSDTGPSAEQVSADASRVLDVLGDGGVAIIPLDVAYAIVGQAPDAIRRIFDAKRRSYDKPSGMFGSWQLSEQLHSLPDDKRQIIRAIATEENLPFSVVAPFDAEHRLLSQVPSFVMASSSKEGTLDMLINAGVLHTEMARQSVERGYPVLGSSANTSLKGSKYRLADIEHEVRDRVDICVDYGKSRYANDQGRSSTIIDFRDFSVLRVGVCFEQLRAVFENRFGITLKQ